MNLDRWQDSIGGRTPVRVVRYLACVVGTMLLISCAAGPGPMLTTAPTAVSWSTYEGAWFVIRYPASFKPRPSMSARDGGGGYDSVFFDSTDGRASFYVLAPQWRRQADDIAIDANAEALASEVEDVVSGMRRQTRLIKAVDGSYQRRVETYAAPDLTTRWTFQFRFADNNARNAYKSLYLHFRESLEQFSD
jgi:hypothetical protein